MGTGLDGLRLRQSCFSIVVAEPTYGDGEHAIVNSIMLGAIAAECKPILFAATSMHHASVREVSELASAETVRREIDVLAPGGVNLHRMRSQWRTLAGLVKNYAPRTLVLLSAGPETLFVARALVARHRFLRLFALLHGNLAEVVGWRSRDPRRRLIDLRSGLAVAHHPRIRLIVLESHIRDAADRIGLQHDFLVWPHPCPSHEGDDDGITPWAPGPRLRLAFVGTASRAKGFDDFLALYRDAGRAYDWSLVGKLGDDYQPDDAVGINRPAGRLSRADFVGEIRQADYAFMALRPEYLFTASGSLLDCIAHRKPLIAVENPMLAGLVRDYGPIGHLCRDLAAVRALLARPNVLRDPIVYTTFQRSLDAIRRDRGPMSLVHVIRDSLQLETIR